jgi:hypothetical protein
MTLIVKPGFNGMTDADAIAYVNAVEAADGQLLEFGVGKAINDFVVGCKLDNTWNAIKASCILAGARTLTGALLPLVGAAPTNVSFVSDDYNRKTGLSPASNAAKYLNSNRNNNADPVDNQHVAVWESTAANGSAFGAGSADVGATVSTSTTVYRTRNRAATLNTSSITLANGFFGISRSSSASYTRRAASTSETVTQASQSALNASFLICARGTPGSISESYAGRLAFYSIGESLDLALLDARVSALITAFGVAIP